MWENNYSIPSPALLTSYLVAHVLDAIQVSNSAGKRNFKALDRGYVLLFCALVRYSIWLATLVKVTQLAQVVHPLGKMKAQSLVVFNCNLPVTCVLIGHRWNPSWLHSPMANALQTAHPRIPRPLKQHRLFACSTTSAVQMTPLHRPSDTLQNCKVSGPVKNKFISMLGKGIIVIAFDQTILRFGFATN